MHLLRPLPTDSRSHSRRTKPNRVRNLIFSIIGAVYATTLISTSVAWRLALYPTVFLFSWITPCIEYMLRVWAGGTFENFAYQVFVTIAYGEGIWTLLAFAAMEGWCSRIRKRLSHLRQRTRVSHMGSLVSRRMRK